MQLEEQIAERVSGFAYDRIDADLLHLLKRNVVDSYAGICGSLKDKTMLANFDRLAAGPASGQDLDVWGIGRKAAYLDAFFMNTVLARRSDLLNTYIPPNGMGGAHPSDNVALVLTLADWLGMDGRAVLTSIHTAFYLSAAFATYYNPKSARYDHDAAATLYTALIIGHAMGMARDQLVSVQRIAGSFGLDINQTAIGPMTDLEALHLRLLCAARPGGGQAGALRLRGGLRDLRRGRGHQPVLSACRSDVRPAPGARAHHLQALAGAGLLPDPDRRRDRPRGPDPRPERDPVDRGEDLRGRRQERRHRCRLAADGPRRADALDPLLRRDGAAQAVGRV